jgi:hypothetical protein
MFSLRSGTSMYISVLTSAQKLCPNVIHAVAILGVQFDFIVLKLYLTVFQPECVCVPGRVCIRLCAYVPDGCPTLSFNAQLEYTGAKTTVAYTSGSYHHDDAPGYAM